jgi:heptosyltransferase-1
MAERTGPRILIIRLSAIGDVVVTTPVSRVLREALPDAHLAWIVESQARDILTGNPYLDEVIVWNRRKGELSPKDMWRLHRMLKPKQFDWVIDFQGLLRSALVARLAGARNIVGNTEAKEYADLLYTIKVPRSDTDPSSRQRCLDLLKPLGIESEDRRMVLPLSEDERTASREILAAGGMAAGEPYVCLVPATTWKQKHWFEERWAELAALLRGRFGVTPVLLGGPQDVPMMERIRSAASGGCVVAAGKTSLKTAAALLEGAALTVAVDTALMHASVAVGTPTVALCGASHWPGFQDYAGFRLLREEMACSPCTHNPTCEGRFDCMRALTPLRVMAAARELIRR